MNRGFERSLVSQPSNSSLDSDFDGITHTQFISKKTCDPQDLIPSIEGDNTADPDTPPPERIPSPALAAFFEVVRANIATNQAIISELSNTIRTTPPEQRREQAFIDALWRKYDTFQPPDHITPVERRRLDEATKKDIRSVQYKIKLLSALIQREDRRKTDGYYNADQVERRANIARRA